MNTKSEINGGDNQQGTEECYLDNTHHDLCSLNKPMGRYQNPADAAGGSSNNDDNKPGLVEGSFSFVKDLFGDGYRGIGLVLLLLALFGTFYLLAM